MANDPKVEAYFEKLEGEVQEIALALRALMDELGPDLTCAPAWNFPCWSGNDRIISIIAHTDRCNLQFFTGYRLAERWPNRVEGTGKQMRHIKVRSVAGVDDELADIVTAAISDDFTDPERVA